MKNQNLKERFGLQEMQPNKVIREWSIMYKLLTDMLVRFKWVELSAWIEVNSWGLCKWESEVYSTYYRRLLQV